MRKPPKNILVSPFEYTLVDDAPLLNQLGGDGAHNGERQEIVYDGKQVGNYLRDSVLHELLHAAYMQTPLYRPDDDEKAREEMLVAAFTPRILALLRDNPELVEWLTG